MPLRHPLGADEIHPLAPGLADFMAFCDGEASSDNPKWASRDCQSFYLPCPRACPGLPCPACLLRRRRCCAEPAAALHRYLRGLAAALMIGTQGQESQRPAERAIQEDEMPGFIPNRQLIPQRGRHDKPGNRLRALTRQRQTLR